jgi:uncharacterized protein (UPF0332 family)
LLHTFGLSSKTHKGAKHLFDENVIYKNLIQKDVGLHYKHLFNYRQESDYEDFFIVEETIIPEMITKTDDFIKIIIGLTYKRLESE